MLKSAYTQLQFSLRSGIMPVWRLTIRGLLILLGVSIYFGMQLALGYGIIGNQLYLIIVGLLALSYVGLVVKSPLAALLTWVVVSPLSTYLLETRFSGGMNFLTFDSVAFFLLFVVFSLKAFKGKGSFSRPSVGELLLLLFVAYILISMLLRGDLRLVTLKTFFFRIGIWPVIYYIVKASVTKKEDIGKYIVAFVVSAAIISSSMIYEHYSGQSVYSLIFRTAIPLQWEDVASGRAAGPFRSPIHCAQLLIPVIFFSLHFMWFSKRKLSKLAYVAVIVAATLSIFFTFTRNNYVSLLLFTLLIPLFVRQRQKLFFAILIAMGFICVTIIAPMYITDKDFSNRMTKDTVNARLVFMNTAYNVIRHNLLFGVGWGNSESATREYVTSRVQYEGLRNEYGTSIPTLVHNTYLFITQENGIVGALLYYGAILAFFIQTLRTYKLAPTKDILGKNFVAIVAVSVIMWLVATFAYSNDRANYANALFWIYFALVMKYQNLLQVEQPDERILQGYSVNA